jgi:DNA-binding NarL/FixJ family response regulator
MRVVVVDDAVLLREGLVRILSDDGIDVVGVGTDAEDALRLVAEHDPDLIILDVRMPPSFTDEGIAVARALRRSVSSTAVLLLSQHVHAGGAMALFDHDAAGLGYLLKDRVIDIDDFLGAVWTVSRGGCVIDPLVVKALVTRQDPISRLDELSPREVDVLELMAGGLSNIAIAARLVLSTRTVETHVNSVFLKLQLQPTEDQNRRVRAVVTYLTHRLDGPHT